MKLDAQEGIDKKKIIEDYYDRTLAPKSAMQKALRKHGISKKDINNFFASEDDTEAFQKTGRQRIASIYSFNVNQLLSIDLTDWSKTPYRVGKQKHRYVMVCIDTFSKKMYCYTMQSKNQPAILRALKSL